MVLYTGSISIPTVRLLIYYQFLYAPDKRTLPSNMLPSSRFFILTYPFDEHTPVEDTHALSWSVFNPLNWKNNTLRRTVNVPKRESQVGMVDD